MSRIDPAQRPRPTTGRTVTPIRTAGGRNTAVLSPLSPLAVPLLLKPRVRHGPQPDRRRRALHDLIAGTAVIYSWGARAARLRSRG